MQAADFFIAMKYAIFGSQVAFCVEFASISNGSFCFFQQCPSLYTIEFPYGGILDGYCCMSVYH